MEFAIATAIGVLAASGLYLMLRARTFDVILGLTLLSYATNLMIFAAGRPVVGKPPVLRDGVAHTLAKRFYAPSEYQWLNALPREEQHSAFYRLWSRKEAVLKAHGDGISAGLDKICFLPEQAWQLKNHLDNRHYEIRDWPAGSGWLSLAAPTRRVDAHLLDARLNSIPLDPMLIHTIFRESAS